METEKPKPWAGLGYEQVPGLANRIIARYLRGQRKNMERFFRERGLVESAERMRQIRLSRQGMMAKNRAFQEVLGEYARGATSQSISEAKDSVGAMDGRQRPGTMDMQPPIQPASSGLGADAGEGIPVVAVEDSGPVIEE